MARMNGELPADLAAAGAKAGIDPTLPERALQDALRRAIADRRGYLGDRYVDVAHRTVELNSQRLAKEMKSAGSRRFGRGDLLALGFADPALIGGRAATTGGNRGLTRRPPKAPRSIPRSERSAATQRTQEREDPGEHRATDPVFRPWNPCRPRGPGALAHDLLRSTALNLLRGRSALWSAKTPLIARAVWMSAHPLTVLAALRGL